MSGHSHRWTGLGIAALLASTSTLVSCGDTDTTEPEVVAPQTPAPAMEGGEGGEGEGGEGEGGVAIAQAATDAVVYKSALAIAKAHVLAARDAHAGGETDAAGEMFSHPAGEVLFEMEPIFAQLGVTPFAEQFLDTSQAIFDGASSDDVAKMSADIITVLDAAAEKAPEDSRSAGRIAAGVVADQIDRAADMYGPAQTNEADVAYGPYLDGYGFYKSALAAYEAAKIDIASDAASADAIIQDAFAALAKAYPQATLPGSLDGNAAQLKAIASRLKLELS
ncbi:MAG: hypothetical protein AAF862_14190 [Pseudomonadota bacterium]